MQSSQPSFYLVSGERSDPVYPTACWPIRRLSDHIRDDYMAVRINPEIPGQKYGLGFRDIDYLLLSTRLAGTTLYPITEWPCHVYVIRVVNENILTNSEFGKSDVEVIGWGTIHKTKEEASKASIFGC
jgi:hypothetical protein